MRRHALKKVHFWAGGAALAPAALGFALPTAAHAATASPTTGGSAKTVSLHHAKAVPAVGCTGSNEFTIPTRGEYRGHGWRTGNAGSACVGTVVVSLKFTKGTASKKFCKDAIASVSAVNLDYGKAHQVCGTAGNWVHTSFSVHERFRVPFDVCASSTYGTGRTCNLDTG
jgi:hypothetical protein